jgi:hypothetical protein
LRGKTGALLYRCQKVLDDSKIAVKLARHFPKKISSHRVKEASVYSYHRIPADLVHLNHIAQPQKECKLFAFFWRQHLASAPKHPTPFCAGALGLDAIRLHTKRKKEKGKKMHEVTVVVMEKIRHL